MKNNMVQSHSEPTAAAIVHPRGEDAAASAAETVIALGASEQAARLNQPSLPSGNGRHRWGDKVAVSPNKSERECRNGCGIVKVARHETEGGRDIHWNEFWRGLDRIEGSGTPSCTAVSVRYDARNYPL